MKRTIVLKLYQERFFIIFTLVIVSLFLVNRYLYKNRYNGFMYTDALNYNQFYFIAESYHIQQLHNTEGDSLKVVIMPEAKSSRWQITDSVQSYNYVNTGFPKVKLHNGRHFYFLNAKNGSILDSVRMEIEYDSVSKNTAVLECNLPIMNQKLFSVARWTRLPQKITSKEIEEVRRILKEEIGIKPDENTLEKIGKIGRYLITNLKLHEGSPSDSIKSLTPLRQFDLACKLNDKIDCANYSDIYFLFANCAGIATRRIGVAGWVDYVTISGHVFNESYIPEQRRWAFVDLTSKKVLVLNGLNKVLNTADLLNANISKTYGKTKVVIVDSVNNLDTVAYRLVTKSELEYFKPTADFYAIKADINNNMNFRESFEEYLGTESHYGTYYANTLEVDNSKHYLKVYVFKASKYIFFIWIIYFVYKIAEWMGLIRIRSYMDKLKNQPVTN